MSRGQARTVRETEADATAATALPTGPGEYTTAATESRGSAAGPPGRARTARRGRTAQAPPLVLGRYRLHRRLGSGAFGTVWLASDERLERDVAVKILPRERIMGGRFEREARAAARLSHPGIVTLYEATVDDEGAYLVSELVRGTTLDKLLASGRLSDQDIVRIGIVLCDALEHAHGEGIVHRDVKPSNILVPERPHSPSQLAKLTDFGVARVVGGDTLTKTGDVIGTLAYMAPEQAEGLEAGPTADLYSLALVLYEALTGVNPARAPAGAPRTRRLGTYLPPLRRQRRELPRELGQGVDQALRPRARERGRISDLRRALMAVREQVGEEAGIVADPWTAGEREPEPQPARTGPWSARKAGEETPLGALPVPRAWPARGLGALGAAATAAWLTAHALSPAPVPPALGALLFGGACLLLPRLGWLGLVMAATVASAAQGHAGLALLLIPALLTPALLMPRRGSHWSLSAGAPALGLVGLAGAWPALAAAAGSAWRRAALGAVGWLWLLLAAAIARQPLYLSWVPATSTSAWAGPPRGAGGEVLTPLVHSGALAPAAVWALGAAVLPWLVRGRSVVADGVLVVVWSATVVSVSTASISLAHGTQAPATAPAAVLGALAGALVALASVWRPAGRLPWRRRLSAGVAGQFP